GPADLIRFWLRRLTLETHRNTACGFVHTSSAGRKRSIEKIRNFMKTGKIIALACLLIVARVQAGTLDVHPDDHICLIGNALADRMQHHGWLETLIQSRFPEHHLVFRNLGFNGDELTIRLRSEGFGSPDEWLTRTKADVIFAFFGYNESFAGTHGLDKFKKDLDQFLKHTL